MSPSAVCGGRGLSVFPVNPSLWRCGWILTKRTGHMISSLVACAVACKRRAARLAHTAAACTMACTVVIMTAVPAPLQTHFELLVPPRVSSERPPPPLLLFISLQEEEEACALVHKAALHQRARLSLFLPARTIAQL